MINPGHPMGHFGSGNRESLKNEKINPHSEVHKWYRSNYNTRWRWCFQIYFYLENLSDFFYKFWEHHFR